MASLRERLSFVEDDFLSAVVDGATAIEAFSERWRLLLEDVQVAIDSSALDDKTVFLAHAVASQIDIFSSSFQDILLETEQIQSSMESELSDVFSRLSIDSLGGVDEKSASSSNIHPHEFGGMMGVAVHQHPSYRPSPMFTRRASPRLTTPSLVSDTCSEDSEEEYVSSNHATKKRGHYEDHVRTDGCKRPRRAPRTSTSHEDSALWAWDEDATRFGDQPPTSESIRENLSKPFLPACTPSEESDPICSPPVHPHKRRLSDSDAHPRPKRPRGLPTYPRKQVVSSVLPIETTELEEQTYNIDDWVADFKEIERATFAPPDPSIPLAIEIFDGWNGHAARASESITSDSTVVAVAQQPGGHWRDTSVAPLDVYGVPSAAKDDAYAAMVACDASLSAPMGFLDGVDAVTNQEAGPWTATTPPPDIGLSCGVVVEPTSCFSSVSAAVSYDLDSVIDDVLFHSASCFVDSALERQHSRPVSSWSHCSAPPSFESIVDSPLSNGDPPSYAPFDQFPQMGIVTPPPPYRHSPEACNLPIGAVDAKVFGGDVLFAQLCTPTSEPGQSHKKRRFSDVFHQHSLVPQAGSQIMV